MTGAPHMLRCLKGALTGLFVSAALLACTPSPPAVEGGGAAPQPRPVLPGTGSAPAAGAAYAPSAGSLALRKHYAQVQQRRLSEGLLRVDGGGPDTRFSAAMLATNFTNIALFREHQIVGGRITNTRTEAPLSRWTGPINLQLTYGASVSGAQRTLLRNEVSRYAARLTRISKHPVRAVQSGGNFHVLVMDQDELRASGPLLQRLVPVIPAGLRADVANMPKTTQCMVIAFPTRPWSNVYGSAVAILRSEHPDLLMRSCLHEEIAQGMGLANDSPRARPSIFNDDEEFALLTTHDEHLLRMLYDPRLRPGMRGEQTTALVRALAAEALGEDIQFAAVE